MPRAFVKLWPFWWRRFVLLSTVSVSLLLPGLFAETGWLRIYFGALFVLAFVTVWRSPPWLSRLSKRVRGFRTRSHGRIILHYPVSLEGPWNTDVLLERCQAEYEDLSRWFNGHLRRRVSVFLLESWRQIEQDFGRPIGGVALIPGSAVVLANDTNLQESIRHELAHLFAARWNMVVRPLFNEGLAVCLARTYNGVPIDTAALPLLGNRGLRLSAMLNQKFFFAQANRNSCYVLAGSFTGFLIRRYGVATYRKFFRKADALNFQSHFRKKFGVSFAKAECQWRTELQVMAVLKRRLWQATR